MRLYKAKLLGISLSLLLILISGMEANAGIPVTDPPTTLASTSEFIIMGKEIKQVTWITQQVDKINSTVGSAMSSFNKYVDEYNQYKDKVQDGIDEAKKYAGKVDGVLGTNLDGTLDKAQGALDKTDGMIGDVQDAGAKAQGGLSDAHDGINKAEEGLNKAGGAYDKHFGGKKCPPGFKSEKGKCTPDHIDANSGSLSGLACPLGTKRVDGRCVKETLSLSTNAGGAASNPTGDNGKKMVNSAISADLKGPGTCQGYFVLPNELAEYCQIDACNLKKIEQKTVIVNCLKKLITQRSDNSMAIQKDARDIYVRTFHETAYANVAEAVVTRNYAINYEQQVLNPLSKKLASAKTVRDDYSGVVMTNKEIANLLNRILMVYASKVSYDALKDYGDFEIYPTDILQLDEKA